MEQNISDIISNNHINNNHFIPKYGYCVNNDHFGTLYLCKNCRKFSCNLCICLPQILQNKLCCYKCVDNFDNLDFCYRCSKYILKFKCNICNKDVKYCSAMCVNCSDFIVRSKKRKIICEECL